MARVSIALACVCLLSAGTAGAHVAPDAVGRAAAQPATAAVFSVSGRGWGHGVGMSQYGALGFAQRGHAYDEILAHYYPGTELGRAPVSRVRVLVAERRKTVSVGSAAAFTVRDADGVVHELPAGTVSFGPGFRLAVEPGRVARPLPGPLVFSPGGAPLEVGGRRYRGTVTVSADRGRVSAVNALTLEAYLFGVVPREVPATWPAEALKAQAVVARSYALAVRRPSGPFDLYADVRSQVYGGMAAEEPATTTAVLATVGQVLLHEGEVATTYFHSTSGGRTAAVEDVWPGSTPVPYLVSVPDPHDAVSPYHSWGPVSVTGTRARRALALGAAPVDARGVVAPSGRVVEVVFALPDGSEKTVPASDVRFRLGLRSTWFRLGVLSLQAPDRSVVTFGSKAKLSGRVRALDGAVLEQRVGTGAWAPVGPVTPGEGGAVSTVVAPRATAAYRLAAGRVRTGTVKVHVAPRVRIEPPTAPTGLRGTVRPVLPGTAVLVQRAEGGRWVTTARTTVDAAGAFAAELELAPGTYRARVAPRGFAVGLSPVLEVVAP